MGFTVSYSAVSWTAGDVITEAKLDAMVANDQAYDSHSAQGFEIDEMTLPSTPAANKIRLYAKDKSGVSTLYYLKDDGTEIELGVVKTTGAAILTGTNDTDFVTPKALADAGVNTRLKSKVIVLSRDGTAASGDVSYTGVGFQPTSIRAVMCIDNTSYWSNGFSDSSKAAENIFGKGNGNVWILGGNLIIYSDQSSFGQSAAVKSYDADGFTLTWTKVGSPTAGTMDIAVICYR